jgi:hypothetical protein
MTMEYIEHESAYSDIPKHPNLTPS